MKVNEQVEQATNAGYSAQPYSAQPSSSAQPAPATSRVVDITTVEQFNHAVAAAKGPVIIDLVQADCGSCEDEKPEVEALAAKCASTTVLRVDVQQLPQLGDRMDELSPDKDWGGTPTLLYAETGDALLKGEVEEVEPWKKLLKRLKCR